MRSGSLDRRIVLQRATYVTNSLNEPVASWADLATVWAEATFKSVTEGIDGQQITATLITRFRIRWSTAVSDLTPKDQLTYGGKTYQIWGVYELGRHVGIEIHATARAD